MKKTLSLSIAVLVLTCTTLFGAAPFETMLVLTNLINLPISTNVNNRVTAFLSGITTTNQVGYTGFYLFSAASTRATNSPTTGATNVFGSIYWNTITSQTTTGRWEQVTWDVAGGAAPGGTAGGVLTGTYPNPGITNVLTVGTSISVPTITVGTLTVTNHTSTGSLAVVTNATVGGTLGVTGILTASTSINTPTETVGTLTVTNHTSTGSLAVVTNATVGGTLGVTGAATFSTSLSTPTAYIGTLNLTNDIPFSSLAQIANNSLLGNFTGGTADIQVLTSITSANMAQVLSDETGTGVAVFGTAPAFTTSISTPSIITASGPLGITPAAGSAVNVTTSGTGDFAVNINQFYVDTSTGSVGIGTTNPGDKLHVAGNIIMATAGVLYTPAGTGAGGWSVGHVSFGVWEGTQLGIATYDTQPIQFAVNNTKVMTLLSGGNVGIGTPGPSATLHVIGGARIGAGADPGANNLSVVGNTTAATTTTSTSAQFTFATGDRAAVFAASGYLTNATATIAEVNFLSGVTTNIQTALVARVLVPIRAAGHPTTLGTVGAGDGQMFVDTATWNRYWWNAALAVWEP